MSVKFNTGSQRSLFNLDQHEQIENSLQRLTSESLETLSLTHEEIRQLVSFLCTSSVENAASSLQKITDYFVHLFSSHELECMVTLFHFLQALSSQRGNFERLSCLNQLITLFMQHDIEIDLQKSEVFVKGYLSLIGEVDENQSLARQLAQVKGYAQLGVSEAQGAEMAQIELFLFDQLFKFDSNLSPQELFQQARISGKSFKVMVYLLAKMGELGGLTELRNQYSSMLSQLIDFFGVVARADGALFQELLYRDEFFDSFLYSDSERDKRIAFLKEYFTYLKTESFQDLLNQPEEDLTELGFELIKREPSNASDLLVQLIDGKRLCEAFTLVTFKVPLPLDTTIPEIEDMNLDEEEEDPLIGSPSRVEEEDDDFLMPLPDLGALASLQRRGPAIGVIAPDSSALNSIQKDDRKNLMDETDDNDQLMIHTKREIAYKFLEQLKEASSLKEFAENFFLGESEFCAEAIKNFIAYLEDDLRLNNNAIPAKHSVIFQSLKKPIELTPLQFKKIRYFLNGLSHELKGYASFYESVARKMLCDAAKNQKFSYAAKILKTMKTPLALNEAGEALCELMATIPLNADNVVQYCNLFFNASFGLDKLEKKIYFACIEIFFKRVAAGDVYLKTNFGTHLTKMRKEYKENLAASESNFVISDLDLLISFGNAGLDDAAIVFVNDILEENSQPGNQAEIAPLLVLAYAYSFVDKETLDAHFSDKEERFQATEKLLLSIEEPKARDNLDRVYLDFLRDIWDPEQEELLLESYLFAVKHRFSYTANSLLLQFPWIHKSILSESICMISETWSNEETQQLVQRLFQRQVALSAGDFENLSAQIEKINDPELTQAFTQSPLYCFYQNLSGNLGDFSPLLLPHDFEPLLDPSSSLVARKIDIGRLSEMQDEILGGMVTFSRDISFGFFNLMMQLLPNFIEVFWTKDPEGELLKRFTPQQLQHLFKVSAFDKTDLGLQMIQKGILYPNTLFTVQNHEVLSALDLVDAYREGELDKDLYQNTKLGVEAADLDRKALSTDEIIEIVRADKYQHDPNGPLGTIIEAYKKLVLSQFPEKRPFVALSADLFEDDLNQNDEVVMYQERQEPLIEHTWRTLQSIEQITKFKKMLQASDNLERYGFNPASLMTNQMTGLMAHYKMDGGYQVIGTAADNLNEAFRLSQDNSQLFFEEAFDTSDTCLNGRYRRILRFLRKFQGECELDLSERIKEREHFQREKNSSEQENLAEFFYEALQVFREEKTKEIARERGVNAHILSTHVERLQNANRESLDTDSLELLDCFERGCCKDNFMAFLESQRAIPAIETLITRWHEVQEHVELYYPE